MPAPKTPRSKKSLDFDSARAIFHQAVTIAKSAQVLPCEWTNHAQAITAGSAKTATVAYATGLLAKATNPSLDPLSLKATGPRSFSARGLAHGVLVPECHKAGISIRSTGREPLNNQPYFRYERIDKIIRSRHPAEVQYLATALKAADDLKGPAALLAFAALLRVQIKAGTSCAKASPSSLGSAITLPQIIGAAQTMIGESAEGGKRAQALVGAIYSLVFDKAHQGRVNDPSRRLAGDVQGMDGAGRVLQGCEVRQKNTEGWEILLFARKLLASDIDRCHVALFAQSGSIDMAGLAKELLAEGSLLLVTQSAKQLIEWALLASPLSAHQCAQKLVASYEDRLIEIEAADATVDRWRELCAPPISLPAHSAQ